MKSISENNCIVVSGEKLSPSNNCTFIMQNRKTIVKGIITKSPGVPAKGFSIEVVQVDIHSNKRTVVGCTFTDCNGNYAFSIAPLCNMVYEFIVYSSLIK